MAESGLAMTLEEASTLLDGVPEYHWLTRNPQSWWSTTEVAKGLGINANIVLGWCKAKQIPGAVEYPGKWSIPRSALVLFLAKRHLNSLPDNA